MSAGIAGFLVGLAVGAVLTGIATDAIGWRGWAYRRGERLLVRKYDGSDWEMATVVAVSWRGSACVRLDGEGGRRGFWIDSGRAQTHVRRLSI